MITWHYGEKAEKAMLEDLLEAKGTAQVLDEIASYLREKMRNARDPEVEDTYLQAIECIEEGAFALDGLD